MTTLKKGSRGDEVRMLQELLRKAGYNIVVDGDYGNATLNAVVAYQKSKSLVADGIVGQKTWEALGAVEKTAANSKCVDPSVIYAPLKYCITKKANRTIKYLAIHYTAGGSSSPGRAISMKTSWEKNRNASADFGVDDRDMVQFNPDLRNYYCWAVGDKKAAKVNVPDGKNHNTISIEICSNLKSGTSASKPNHEGWYFTEASLNNAVKLAKIIMQKYNIPVERVVRHFDISGKLCPGVVGYNDGVLHNTNGTKTNKRNNSKAWEEFKKRLK